MKKEAVVDFDPEKIDAKKMKKALRSAGFGSEIKKGPAN